MKGRIALVALGAATAGAAGGSLAVPPPEVVRELVLTSAAASVADGAEVKAGGFVAGDRPGDVLAPVTVHDEYWDSVYAALFSKGENGWALAAWQGPVASWGVFDPGADAPKIPAAVAKIAAAARTYYVFTGTEVSSGSGMSSRHDNYYVYAIRDGALESVFEGQTRTVEDYYARWYGGGDDSSAWADGGRYETASTFDFADVDGDGVSELWEERTDGEKEPWTYAAFLYALGDDGIFAEAPLERYRPALEKAGDFRANLALADGVLKAEGDVSAARGYLEKAAALKSEAAAGIAGELALLDRLAHDPADAVALYYNQEYREVLTRYPNAAAAAEATLAAGDFHETLAFLGKYPDHPGWCDAFSYAAVEAVAAEQEEGGGVSAKDFKKLNTYVGRYEQLETDAEDKAETFTRLGDGYYHRHDYKKAAAKYERSLEIKDDGVFADYNILRLGDCAAAEGYDAAALALYVDCAETGGWWASEAEDALLNRAVLETPGGDEYYADVLADGRPYADIFTALGELDGKDGPDFAAVVSDRESRDRLYYFIRAGNAFRGRELIGGDEGSAKPLFAPKILPLFADGRGVLKVDQAVETDAGRNDYLLLYAFDGVALREVARIKLGETETADPPYEYRATPAFTAGDRPAVTVTGTIHAAEGEAPVEVRYIWDEGSFSFVPAGE
jgi:hypothetical protein